MVQVLVTGGTGVLGSYLVPRLVDRGHDVRVLSRRPGAVVPAGVAAVQGDVRTGAGLSEAVRGVDVVVHAATSPRRRVRATEVDGSRHLVEAAASAGGQPPHLIYVSIVGVDQMTFPYYRAKWAAEQVFEREASRWTIQRATQFHDLLDMFLRGRIFPGTRHMAFQPVDAGEVSDRLAGLVDAGPSGRVNDMGGPEVVPFRQLCRSWRAATGKRAFVLPAPAVGYLRQFDEGRHLCRDHADGRITWESWLRARYGAGSAAA